MDLQWNYVIKVMFGQWYRMHGAESNNPLPWHIADYTYITDFRNMLLMGGEL